MATDVVEERGRLGTRLARQYDAEGKEIKFDVREDEEQNVKLQETVELLVAAGYFRARIKGLSAFDKVIGGMVWCVSFCDIDIDIDLLYEENSTIGQKIKLTEKIVKVLSKIKCPFRIEPHQIQGLDFIHIFPVVQWLVKKAIRAREEVGDTVQKYAEYQYEAHYRQSAMSDRQKSDMRKWEEIQRSVAVHPKRIYKRAEQSPLIEESSRVQSTLLEYGCGKLLIKAALKQGEDEAVTESGKEQKQEIENLMAAMTEISDKIPRLSVAAIASVIDESGIREMAAQLADEIGDMRVESRLVGTSVTTEETLEMLENRKDYLDTILKQIPDKCEQLKKAIAIENENLERLQAQETELTEEMKNLQLAVSMADKNAVQTMQSLLDQREEIKKRESAFKAQCKEEVTKLEYELAILRQRGSMMEENQEMLNTLREKRDKAESDLREIRLDAASINRRVAMLQRRIDDIPSHTELNQYQRRFLELYNQIASKHKETKQLYALFNTLQDVKGYMEKEVNLLNSIYDNYQIAMQTDQNKIQFLNQLEQSLESIKQSKIRLEKKEIEQRSKRDALRDNYQELLDKQRLYYRTVKDFQEECRKNEMASTLLKEADLDEHE